jgi:O-antigen/teichoic acid export membrane protein
MIIRLDSTLWERVWQRTLARRGVASLRTIFLNLQWLSLSTAVTAGSAVLVSALLARRMGAWSFGQWALIASTASWLTVVRGGVGQHLTRLSSSNCDSARALLLPSWMLLGLLGAILGSAGIGLNVALQSRALAVASLFAVGGTFLSAAQGMVICVFAGRDQMHWALADGAQSLAAALALLALPTRYLSVETVASLYLGTAALVAIPVMIAGVRIIRPVLPVHLVPAAWELIASNVWLVGIQLSSVFHLAVDLYLLQAFGDAGKVGVFSAALKIIIAARLLPWLVMMSVIPGLSRGSERDNRLAARVWSVVTHTLLPLEGILVIVLACVPRLVLSALYSRSFPDAALPLTLLGASLIPHSLWQILAASVMAKGHYKLHFVSSMVCCVAHAIVSVVLIKRYGVPGAAGAFFLGECAALLSIAVVASRTLGSFPYAQVWRFLASLGGSLALGSLAAKLGSISLLVCSIAIICYLCFLMASGMVSRRTLAFVFHGADTK